MRTLFAAVVAGLALTAAAQEPPKADPPAKNIGKAPAPKKKAEATLKVGDKAPELKADKWLQGAEVKGFEAGKVYVVEFWATWCGPCIVMMPHMADLQDDLKAKGVTLVGYSAKDPNNTREKVEAFVAKQGPKLGYTFAYADDRDTYDAWMRAAGQNGIPCCFVVGKDGTIAYIGHPMYLDLVLPKVAAGTWDAAKDGEALADAGKDVDGVFDSLRKADAEEFLKAYSDFAAKWPALADVPYFNGSRLTMMAKVKKFDAVKALAETLLAKAGKRGDTSSLVTVANALSAVKDQSELTALSLKAADANLAMAGDADVNALLTARATYAAAGEKDKAKGFADKAIAAAEKELKGDDDVSGLMRLVALCRVAGEADKAKGFAVKAAAAAEKAVKGDSDWQGNLRLAGAYKAAGDADKAKAAAQKALDNAPQQAKAMVGQQAKQYGAEVKKDDK